jgi:cytochrome c oxidase subunit I+III
MSASVAAERNLHRTWANAHGLVGQLTAVNHSTIGLRFIATGLVFLLIGGLLAMFIRLQLAFPGNTVLDHERYNQFVTMHGTTLMFLFAVPILEGFALYLIPKMIGARDVPFPRLTAFGYWCYLFGGIFLYSSFFFGAAPRGGWFMYPPLTSDRFTPDLSADFWLLGVTFAEIAAVAAAVELIVAILKTRAPGMSIQRMPLFAWYILATAFMIAFGFPPLILASVLLELERAFGFVFYDPTLGGDPLLWQHLFWLFGHPDVYIIFLPAAGVVSTLIPTFASRPMVGYLWIVLAVIGTAFLSFGLWVHHMYTVGIPLLALSFFSAASMAVAIPMGIQIAAWIATLWSGRPRVETPMLFVIGFFAIFVIGGLTGLMVAVVPFDWQVHDTHFIVAHLHYVLLGGMVFPIFAGIYYWLPLVSGRAAAEFNGRAVFWLLFIGVHVTFLPMHLTGLLGLPRRVYTYSAELGDAVTWLNVVSTAGGFTIAAGMIAFVTDLVLTFRHGRRARPDPWRAGTLEWALPMPPPAYNFASTPAVAERDPLWARPNLPEALARGEGYLPNASHGRRETLGTSVRAAEPEHVIRLSDSTWLPLIAAAVLTASLTAFLLSAYLVSAGLMAAATGVILRWLWTTGDVDAPLEIDAGHGLRLPTHSASAEGPGAWAVIIVLLINGALFASLVFAYYFLWLGAPAWPPAGHAIPGAAWPGVALVTLVASGFSTAAARRHLAANDASGVRRMLAVAGSLMAAFIAASAVALIEYGQTPAMHAYASVVHTLIGFAVLHALIALLIAGFAAVRVGTPWLSAERPLAMRVLWLFWWFTIGVGAIATIVVHVSPRIL